MLDPDDVPPVDPQEMLSRFILSSRHFNRHSCTLKADAFVPHPHQELSVTRDREAAIEEIRQAGTEVAKKRGKTLFGRGDALAATYIGQDLEPTAAPINGNPNHVNVIGWPMEKHAQKLIAKEIAAVARLVEFPEE